MSPLLRYTKDLRPRGHLGLHGVLARAVCATDVEAMRLLVAHGADANIPIKTPPPAGTIT